MVHRDLKPENILLDANLTIYLCAFSISKVGTGCVCVCVWVCVVVVVVVVVCVCLRG